VSGVFDASTRTERLKLVRNRIPWDSPILVSLLEVNCSENIVSLALLS
jgi:hypothetical protein